LFIFQSIENIKLKEIIIIKNYLYSFNLLTSASAIAKIDIQASSSCKLSSTNDVFANCLDVGVLGFFESGEFDRSNEILSDSSSVFSSSWSLQKIETNKNDYSVRYLPVIDFN
jgi:hypothetical protein